MTRAEYMALSDDELDALCAKGDGDAVYYRYLRHRSAKLGDIPSRCGIRADDNDYFGNPEEGNR